MFRVGDKVRCIDPYKDEYGDAHTLLKNRSYYVVWAAGIRVKVKGDTWEWFANRFEKVQPNGRAR